MRLRSGAKQQGNIGREAEGEGDGREPFSHPKGDLKVVMMLRRDILRRTGGLAINYNLAAVWDGLDSPQSSIASTHSG